MTPRLDPEFQKLLPPLSPDEFAELEASILDEGIRESFVAWLETGILLDGHNRLAIAEKHGLPYPTPKELSFADRDAAEEWMLSNQLGRRNLSHIAHKELLGHKYEVRKRQGARTDLTSPQSGEKLTTAEVIAAEEGVSKNTVERAASLAQDMDAIAEVLGDDVRQDLRAKDSGATETDIHKLAEVARKAPKTARKIIKKATEIKEKTGRTKLKNATKEVLKEETPPPTIPRGSFSVIYADPPWQYRNDGLAGAASEQYSTLTTEDLCALPVGERAAENAVLFLWVTNPLLTDGLALLSAWGFNYKTNLAWVKDKPTSRGLGSYLRGQHELLLIGTRGSMLPDKDAMPLSVLQVPKREHSRKPDEAYALIEAMYPNTKRLELFARTQRDGWTAMGNEVGKWEP